MAGHSPVTEADGGTVLIDAHGSPVTDPVWALYAEVISRTGPLPTLIERDANVPPLDVLIAEAQHAEQLLRGLPRAA